MCLKKQVVATLHYLNTNSFVFFRGVGVGLSGSQEDKSLREGWPCAQLRSFSIRLELCTNSVMSAEAQLGHEANQRQDFVAARQHFLNAAALVPEQPAYLLSAANMAMCAHCALDNAD